MCFDILYVISGSLFCHLAKLHIQLRFLKNKVFKNIKIMQRDKILMILKALF